MVLQSAPVLSVRALNRALLARQHLLERAAAPPGEVAARVCGLQTQHAPSGYVGMWSRTAGLRKADLTAALGRAEVVQGWVMRSTIHMVAAADYGPFTDAVRAARRAQWLRAEKRAAGLDMPAVAAAVRGYLADGPLTQPRLVALLQADGFPRVAWVGVQLWVDLLRVPPTGTWEKPRANLFALAEQVLARGDPGAAAPDQSEPGNPGAGAPDQNEPGDPDAIEAARQLLVTRYLRAFGPASAADVASFTGIPLAEVRAVLTRCDLRWFRGADGGHLADVPDGLLPEADVPAPVRFLGTWDATLLVHARRTQLLPEAYRPRVFATTMPRSVPTFLVDGQVAGTWAYTGGQVVTTSFDDGGMMPGPSSPSGPTCSLPRHHLSGMSGSDRSAVEAEAERLTVFHAAPE